MRLGLIGLGHMGTPVARRLLNRPHPLAVHDLRQEATAPLVDAGALWCDSPAAVARVSGVVFLSLPGPGEVEQVTMHGGDRLLGAMRPGSYLVDLSTVSVHTVDSLVTACAAAGVRYLACPVSQGVDNAAVGKLTVFAGGPADVLDDVEPLLRLFATTVVRAGTQRQAVVAKLVTNLLWFAHVAILGEALVLGAGAGIDLGVLRRAILTSCGTSWVAEHDLGSIYDGTFDPSFTTGLCQKDLILIGEIAREQDLMCELDVYPTVRRQFDATASRYGADSPELSVVRRLAEMARVTLRQ